MQVNRGTVVNMKVHTDPKNSYMHPFVWQSITVRKFFFTLAKLFSHLICTYIGSLAPANFTGAVQKRPYLSHGYSLAHVFSCILWPLMISLMRIWFMRIFTRSKKARELRTWCMSMFQDGKKLHNKTL